MSPALSTARSGEAFRITDVPDDVARAQLLRLGLLDGAVECRRRINDGPVVIERNGTQFAIGAALADDITIDREA